MLGYVVPDSYEDSYAEVYGSRQLGGLLSWGEWCVVSMLG